MGVRRVWLVMRNVRDSSVVVQVMATESLAHRACETEARASAATPDSNRVAQPDRFDPNRWSVIEPDGHCAGTREVCSFHSRSWEVKGSAIDELGALVVKGTPS